MKYTVHLSGRCSSFISVDAANAESAREIAGTLLRDGSAAMYSDDVSLPEDADWEIDDAEPEEADDEMD